MKKTIIAIVLIIIIGAGIYFFTKESPDTGETPNEETPTATSTQPVATTTPVQTNAPQTVIGTSVGGTPITAYHYGTGSKELLFVGGIHGGYEWNTVLVAQQLADYLKANPSIVPSSLKVTVIPVLNPDGLSKVVGTTTGAFTKANVNSSQAVQVSGRFNGNTVDLNRNFDCQWQSEGTWQSTKVSGGSAAFSEPESMAIKSYVEMKKPTAVVVWYSAAGGVYASSCGNSVSTETAALVKAYSDASGYKAHATFDAYPTTGDMTNWLAKINIPTISVLLTNHTDTEWTKNLAGVQALLTRYSTAQ